MPSAPPVASRSASRLPAILAVLAVGYLAALHLVIAALVVRPDDADALQKRLFPNREGSNPHVGMMVTFHARMDPFVPAGAAVFLGDSITQGLLSTTVVPASINFGIGGQNSRELLLHLPRYRSLQRAGAVFLLIGINDLAWGEAAGLPARLGELARALPQDRPLIWSGILPAYTGGVTNGQISAVNEQIRALCAARPQCHYVDTHRALPVGDETLFIDGIHPGPTGYARWIAALTDVWQHVGLATPGARVPGAAGITDAARVPGVAVDPGAPTTAAGGRATEAPAPALRPAPGAGSP